MQVGGATLLLDPETRQAFLPPEQSSRDGRMPTFCGRFAADGAFAPHRPLCDFLDAAKRFCQTRRVSVAELFRLYDDSAKLSFARFAKLVRDVEKGVVKAGGAPAAADKKTKPKESVASVFARFDANKSGFLDYRELRPALKHYGLDVSERGAAEVLP